MEHEASIVCPRLSSAQLEFEVRTASMFKLILARWQLPTPADSVCSEHRDSDILVCMPCAPVLGRAVHALPGGYHRLRRDVLARDVQPSPYRIVVCTDTVCITTIVGGPRAGHTYGPFSCGSHACIYLYIYTLYAWMELVRIRANVYEVTHIRGEGRHAAIGG